MCSHNTLLDVASTILEPTPYSPRGFGPLNNSSKEKTILNYFCAQFASSSIFPYFKSHLLKISFRVWDFFYRPADRLPLWLELSITCISLKEKLQCEKCGMRFEVIYLFYSSFLWHFHIL